MIKTIKKKNFLWIKKNFKIFKKIKRGIEKESVRIEKNGKISNLNFPSSIGCPLHHKWITTDFSESLLELVTPTFQNIKKLLYFLQDLHKYTLENIEENYLWPFSIPYMPKKKIS